MSLSAVYPPEGSSIAPAVDIIAVHGLGGDAVDAWTHPRSKAFWLKDFLPQQIPDARILTFGYNAVTAFGNSTSGVIDHAKSLLSDLVDKREKAGEKARPLIFLAHSLGGIVAKQVLLSARLEPRYQPISDATIGIVFFGTPHRGSDKAAYGRVLANIAQVMTHKPTSALVNALQSNGQDLQQLTTDFRHQLPRYQVVSFYEQRPMKPFKTLIVEKHSALLEVENEDQIPVDADHSAICKFEREDDMTYEKLWKRIRRIRESMQKTTTHEADTPSVAPYNEHYEVPQLLSPVFTGRDEIYQSLEASLTQSFAPRQGTQRRFVLYGLGGSGKTQICLKYAQSHRERYWGVFWVDASSHVSVQQSMNRIALLLHTDQTIENVKRVLTNIPQPWLLLFDNADDPKLHLATYFPAGDRGDIIITSRNPACCQYSTVGCKEIGNMSIRESVDLLLKTADSGTVPSESVQQGAEDIVQTLGCLALAVTQAGAYIREKSCSLEDYLELYRRRRKEVLAFSPSHNGTDYRYTVYTTWQVSLDMIASMQDTRSQCALKLLKLICFYHHERIPLTMIFDAWCRWPKNDHTASDWLPWPEKLTDLFDVRQAVLACISLLKSYSLVARDVSDTLSLHPVVHEWCLAQMSKEEQLLGSQRAFSLLATSTSWTTTEKDYDYRRLLVPHVLTGLDAYKRCGGEVGKIDDHINYDVWSVLALVLDENGFHRDAATLMEPVVNSRISNAGEEDLDTLRSMHFLARYYHTSGQQEAALSLARQVAKLRKNKLGEEHIETLKAVHNVACYLHAIGEEKEAFELLEQVTKLRKSKFGEEHPDTLISRHGLIVQLHATGRPTEALELLEQLVKLQKDKLGEAHPNTLSSMHSLALYLKSAKRHGEALKLMEQVVKLRKDKLGEAHSSTFMSMYNLAVAYETAGRLEEASRLAEQIVQLGKSNFGEEHLHTVRSIRLLTHLNAEIENKLSSGKSEIASNGSNTLDSTQSLPLLNPESEDMPIRGRKHLKGRLSKLMHRFS